MDQMTFAEAEYDGKRRKTRREKFLEQMDGLIPWKKLEKKIQPHYPKNGNGRQPYPLPVMLRIHCMQLFYNLSDPAMEDALYEIESMRRFAGLRLSDRLPDETTILNFRHLLERHNLGKRLFDEMNRHLSSQGLRMREGSIVDATIIAAPTSTKNAAGERDPEMHQTKKGNEWHFGMKMHIGTDDALGLIHSLSTTPANVHDITQVDQLLHGDEERVWGDAGYQGIEKREEHASRKVHWNIAMRPGQRKHLVEGSRVAATETLKASV
jgi:IS5 family transposase